MAFSERIKESPKFTDLTNACFTCPGRAIGDNRKPFCNAEIMKLARNRPPLNCPHAELKNKPVDSSPPDVQVLLK